MTIEMNTNYTTKGNRKYRLNHDYFENIDSEEKAYFLGFIFADGCVSLSNNNFLLRIEIHKDDIEILEKFKISISSTSPIKFNKNKNSVNIRLFSKKLIKDLIATGCVERKSLILKFPDNKIVPDIMINHFMRGYFDGDGSLKISSRKNYHISKRFPDRIPNRYKTYTFSVVSNHLFMNAFQDKLCKFCDFNKTKMFIKENITEMDIVGRIKLKKIYDFLFNDAKTFLKRKHDRFIEAIVPKTGHTKLSVEQVKEIRLRLVDRHETLKNISNDYGVSRTQIGLINSGKSRQNIS